jgi:predicted DNA-binding transcriptional regulator YafY
VGRQSRLFAIAEHLRARRTGVTAEELAERFEVTVRTIYRDLETLRDASLPLHAERGRGGGYSLDRAYTLPPLNLTPREAALLVTLGRWATEMRLLPFTETLARALDKVRGALSTSAQRELLQSMDSLKFVGVPALPIADALRRQLERAWFERAPLRIHYRNADGVASSRTVVVDSVILDRRVTLLNCRDVEDGAERQYRLDRIESAVVIPAALGQGSAVPKARPTAGALKPRHRRPRRSSAPPLRPVSK